MFQDQQIFYLIMLYICKLYTSFIAYQHTQTYYIKYRSTYILSNSILLNKLINLSKYIKIYLPKSHQFTNKFQFIIFKKIIIILSYQYTNIIFIPTAA